MLGVLDLQGDDEALGGMMAEDLHGGAGMVPEYFVRSKHLVGGQLRSFWLSLTRQSLVVMASCLCEMGNDRGKRRHASSESSSTCMNTMLINTLSSISSLFLRPPRNAVQRVND
jgi:hypothetical protein